MTIIIIGAAHTKATAAASSNTSGSKSAGTSNTDDRHAAPSNQHPRDQKRRRRKRRKKKRKGKRQQQNSPPVPTNHAQTGVALPKCNAETAASTTCASSPPSTSSLASTPPPLAPDTAQEQWQRANATLFAVQGFCPFLVPPSSSPGGSNTPCYLSHQAIETMVNNIADAVGKRTRIMWAREILFSVYEII